MYVPLDDMLSRPFLTHLQVPLLLLIQFSIFDHYRRHGGPLRAVFSLPLSLQVLLGKEGLARGLRYFLILDEGVRALKGQVFEVGRVVRRNEG